MKTSIIAYFAAESQNDGMIFKLIKIKITDDVICSMCVCN
jgi:hypothetical protein